MRNYEDNNQHYWEITTIAIGYCMSIKLPLLYYF